MNLMCCLRATTGCLRGHFLVNRVGNLMKKSTRSEPVEREVNQ